jgi:rubrerythrin
LQTVNDDDNIIPEDEMKHLAEMLQLLHALQDEKENEAEPKDIDHSHAVQALLLEYRKQFQETADFIRNKNEPVPQNILDAIRYIDNQIAHWAGLS